VYNNYFDASQKQGKIGVLLLNIGTPVKNDKSHIKKYLKEFLSDKRVIENADSLKWRFLLNCIIAPSRPSKLISNYETVYGKNGFVLDIISKKQKNKLAKELKNIGTDKSSTLCEIGLLCGKPTVEEGFKKLMEAGVQNIIVLPLFPQHCSATTGSCFDAITKLIQQHRVIPNFSFINSYHLNKKYIDAISNKISLHWENNKQSDILLLSFHGIPQSSSDAGDIYYKQCMETADAIVGKLQLKSTQYKVSFQSRFGKQTWLTPYTSELLQSLPAQGVSSIDVVCPGFASDCLETLEEIEVENKEYFLQAGGKEFSYIPSLNDDDEHIELMLDLVQSKLS
jgi:ferrochelatase